MTNFFGTTETITRFIANNKVIERLNLNIHEKIAGFQNEIVEIEENIGEYTGVDLMRSIMLYETMQYRDLSDDHREVYGDMLNFFNLLSPGWSGFDYDLHSSASGVSMITLKAKGNHGGGNTDITLPYEVFTLDSSFDLIGLYYRAYKDHSLRGGMVYNSKGIASVRSSYLIRDFAKSLTN